MIFPELNSGVPQGNRDLAHEMKKLQQAPCHPTRGRDDQRPAKLRLNLPGSRSMTGTGSENGLSPFNHGRQRRF